MIKLGLVDDEVLFLNGLRAILDQQEQLEVILTASGGQDFFDLLQTAPALPDVLLLDLRMQPMDGIEVTRQLKESHPDLKVIILSTYYRDSFLAYMVQLGVSAFLPKNLDVPTLVKAIEKVHEKGLYFTDEHVQSIQRQMMSGEQFQSPDVFSPVTLTKREKEVLHLICDQHSSPEIAEKLFVSTRTVEGHRNNLLLKTGARNTVGLVLFALLNNLIDVEKKLLEFTLD